VLLLIPTRRRLTKRATEKVAVHMAFKQLFDEFIEACQIGKIKTIFPNVFQMFSILDHRIRINWYNHITKILRKPESSMYGSK
jgi:hypothetical protein